MKPRPGVHPGAPGAPGPGAHPGAPGLDALRRRVAQLEKISGPVAQAGGGLTWGIDAIDRHLPGSGLSPGALHEFSGSAPDLEEASLAAAAVAHLVGRRQQQEACGSFLWIARQRDLYARALPGRGVDPSRLLHLRVRRNDDALWAMEEALRCAGLCAVVAELSTLDLTQSRRLQLAAEKSGVPALVIRRSGRAGQLRHLASQPIAAMTRWRMTPAPSAAAAAAQSAHPALPDAARWLVELWRCRGGRPGSWLLEEHDDGWREAAFPQPVAATLADRPLVAATPGGARRAAG